MLHPYGEGTEIDGDDGGDDGGDDTDDTGTVTVTVFPSTTVVITVDFNGTEGDGLHTSSHGGEETTSYTISG